MSSILFIIAIDPILKAIQRGQSGIHNLLYADDEVIIEDSVDDLNESIKFLTDTASKIGLSVNPKNCYSLHISEDHKSCINTSFNIIGTPVAILFNYDITSYIGKPFGFNIAPDSNDINEYIDSGKKILASELAPWQKIDALKTFLYPSFHYALRTNRFAKKDWTL